MGFDKTSMSLCILIQPKPMLSELCNLQGTNGLIDRFLFITAKLLFSFVSDHLNEPVEMLSFPPSIHVFGSMILALFAATFVIPVEILVYFLF